MPGVGGMVLPPFACRGMFLVLLFPWKFCWASYQFLPTGKGKSLASKLVANGARKPQLFCAWALAQAQGQNIPVSLKSHAMFRQCLARWSAEITHAASFIRGGFKMNSICTNAPAREMSTCIAFKFVHSAFDYESVAELNPSRANFLFSYPARTAQNVSNWMWSCGGAPVRWTLKPATISGSLIHSCTYPYCQNSTFWGWNIHRQKFELQLWIVASKAPSLSRWTWEQTRDSSLANRCKQPSNEKLDRRNEHYQISFYVKCTGAGGAMRQPATFISMLANDISWSSRFTPTSYGPCFGGERTAAILHPFGHLLCQTSIPTAVDCLQSARRSGPAPSPGLIATNGKPHHFKAFAAGTRYAICRI